MAVYTKCLTVTNIYKSHSYIWNLEFEIWNLEFPNGIYIFLFNGTIIARP
jgi:hypothetical protein